MSRLYAAKVQALFETSRDGEGRLRDKDGMSVEEFGEGLVDNLMIACGVERLCGTAEEAIKEAGEILNKK